MFRFAQPISGYDIAAIVQRTMHDKQKAHAPEGSIIDQLIEEALFEFTSLKGDGGPASGNLSAEAAPLNADAFRDPRTPAHEISLGDRTPAFGNLSELEDSASGRNLLPRDRTPPPFASAALPPPPEPSGDASRQRPSGSPSGARGTLIGIVLFLVVAAAASAAWFTGIIPHH